MKLSEMEAASEIEPCRTCGIFFLTSANCLRHLFDSDPELVHVRRELQLWNIELIQNDRFPQYICTVCLLEFRKIFKFQLSCMETQIQWRQLYDMQQNNLKVKIKTEQCDDIAVKPELPEFPGTIKQVNEDENICAFIYVDDLSDEEYDGNEGATNVATFKIPHIPIKEEVIEEALVPIIKKEEKDFHFAKDDNTPESSNEIGGGIQCHLCLHISADQQEHRQHTLRIHETKPLECHICGKQFKKGSSNTRLKYHLKWHRLNKHIKCSQCGFHCTSRDVLSEHMRAVHTKTPCTICGKLLLPKKLRNHMQEHQASNSMPRLECPYCVMDFGTDVERNQHILWTHMQNVNETNLISQNVSSENIRSPFMNLGSQIQENPAQLQTEFNGSSTETNSDTTTMTALSFSSDNSAEDDLSGEVLSNDEKEVGDYENSYTIEDDGAAFEDEISLQEINAGYDNLENVEVEDVEEEEDDETSTSKSFSNVTIQDEMQFACAQCPMTFSRVEQLMTHSKTHDQQKPLFECPVCSKIFDLKFTLNRHIKRHKNETL